MATKVTFRVVGIYCYLPYLELPNIDASSSTVQDVMDAIQKLGVGFSYVDKGGSVDTMSYLYTQNSTRPFNTSAPPINGPRHESEIVGSSEALAWQYYRSVSGSFPGDQTLYEIKIANPTFSQPLYSKTPLAAGLQIPSNFTIFNFNLTWRLLKLQLSPDAARLRSARLSARLPG